MKFDVDSIYFGVAVQMSNRTNTTYINSSDSVKVWFEDGFFLIDDGGPNVICIVSPNVKQFTKKRVNESAGVKDSPKVRSTKLDK